MPNLTWEDYDGAAWPVLDPLTKLAFTVNRTHAALRAHVFIRDGFHCQATGCRVRVSQPSDFDGSISPVTSKGPLFLGTIDKDRTGDRLHPDNLQTLCWACWTRQNQQRVVRSGCAW